MYIGLLIDPDAIWRQQAAALQNCAIISIFAIREHGLRREQSAEY